MEPIGEPRIEYTAAEFPDKAGFTAVQIIVTSSIVAHFIDSTGDVYIDVKNAILYGPKKKGVWPLGVSLKGSDGKSGIDGKNGSDCSGR